MQKVEDTGNHRFSLTTSPPALLPRFDIEERSEVLLPMTAASIRSTGLDVVCTIAHYFHSVALELLVVIWLDLDVLIRRVFERASLSLVVGLSVSLSPSLVMQ
jgi:hypothetical protein